MFATIPHSGLTIPPEVYWLKTLPHSILFCDVDLFVDELYGPFLKKLEIPFIVFPWHRYAVDANRWPEDKTPLTVQGASKKPLKEISTDIHWQQTTKGDILIKEPISFSLHKTLVEKYFNPFHKKIERQIQDFKENGFRSVYHIDLHSMPSLGTAIHRDPGQKRPDVVISNQEGTSASQHLTERIKKAFEYQNLNVSLNWPYRGGRISQTYGQPKKQQHTIQIELNRRLYMNEKTFTKTKEFALLQQKLSKALSFIKEGLKED